MEESENVKESVVGAEDSPKTRNKPRGKKRKRIQSESGSESECLPENAFEVEKNVIASAVKNNLDDISVKKILKKVVTNDHVLALVKLREEEESSMEESNLIPKLTRSKVKELTKVSPKSAPWNIQNLELTPIKHIPVKTRPEVKALIAQELPEDEDDEEYEPTNDDVPSDDDQGLESCSDLDSQPRTPATPRSQQRTSPKIVKDGPFKVPPEVSPARRKLDLAEEEATIALRTRSKLCLSETPIEHIESSFVPPDEVPVRVDDHLWNDFLTECLNPASVSRNEDDDETDPEYNVAADPDAPDDDDEEALERSILKISKKELNDLVTELFNIMPEASVDDELGNLANGVLTDQTNHQTPPLWEGKQEPVSEDEGSIKMVDRIVFERRSSVRKYSVGKMESDDLYEKYEVQKSEEAMPDTCEKEKEDTSEISVCRVSSVVDIQVEERMGSVSGPEPPASLRRVLADSQQHRLEVTLDSDNVVILPEQILILQQQLRQHIQLATSNFLQIFVHPIHWALGPTYKEYIESLVKLHDSNPNSVVNVCNLKPAMELCETWERTVSEDTPENKQMVAQRRIAQNCLYVGEFHETVQRTIANSPVFLYPHLLPPMPYRAISARRSAYLPSEDSLIALGLDQFWDYVENNPDLYKRPSRPRPRSRWGLSYVVELISKHMFPWLAPKVLTGHIMKMRLKDKENPINKFFTTRTVEPVKQKLLPYNPALTLYEQPEHELPRIWVRYLARTSKRFKDYLYRRRTKRATYIGEEPDGVEVNVGLPTDLPAKEPLPIDFTKEIVCHRINSREPTEKPPTTDKFDVQIESTTKDSNPSFFKLVHTSLGVNLEPLDVVHATLPSTAHIVNTNTVNCNVTPISSAIELRNDTDNVLTDTQDTENNEQIDIPNGDESHCQCCILLRSICKKQTLITDYFKRGKETSKSCRCRERRGPRVSKKLRLLVDRYKQRQECVYRDLMKKLEPNEESKKKGRHKNEEDNADKISAEDIEIVNAYQIKLTLLSIISKHVYLKRRIVSLFSKFDPDSDDPVKLANSLEEALNGGLVELHKEFLGFLTPEQAERLGHFRHYFTNNCLTELARKVEEQVSCPVTRQSILQQLKSFFAGRWAACAMCASLLSRMRGHHALAQYTFDLFPHRAGVRNPEPNAEAKKVRTPKKVPEPAVVDDAMDEDEDAPSNDLLQEIPAPDYEADHSSSGEEECESDPLSLSSPATKTTFVKIQLEPDQSIDNIQCKVEPSDDDSSEMSMMIMSEDDPIKTEPIEWKREEDKEILEVLKVHLTPEERKDKTIMEILEEKKVADLLSQSLTNKSIEAVTDRIMYLLNVLLLCDT